MPLSNTSSLGLRTDNNLFTIASDAESSRFPSYNCGASSAVVSAQNTDYGWNISDTEHDRINIHWYRISLNSFLYNPPLTRTVGSLISSQVRSRSEDDPGIFSVSYPFANSFISVFRVFGGPKSQLRALSTDDKHRFLPRLPPFFLLPQCYMDRETRQVEVAFRALFLNQHFGPHTMNCVASHLELK